MIKSSEIPLATELATFQAHKAELLGRHRNGFALIKGRDILGTFDTQGDANQDGCQRLGNAPFLIRRIVEVEVPLRFTRDVFIAPTPQTVGE